MKFHDDNQNNTQYVRMSMITLVIVTLEIRYREIGICTRIFYSVFIRSASMRCYKNICDVIKQIESELAKV